MRQDSTEERRKRAIREALGILILGAVILYLASMAGFFSVSEAGAKPRPTVVGCRPGVEGRDFCPDGFATSQAKPGQFDRPRTATPQRRTK